MSGTAERTPAPAPARDAAPQPGARITPTRAPTARHLLQRVHRGAGNGVVQRLLAAGDGRLRAPAGVTREIERRRGGGRPLDPGVRQRMENAVGADLGSVRVHTDGTARGLTDSLDARAFTSGSDVFFSPGSYRPDSSDGRRLLAHELTHVAQQAAGRVPGSPGEIRPPGDALEREAESTARRSTARPSGAAGRRRRRNGGLQRQEAAAPVTETPAPGPETPAPGAAPAAAAPEEEGGFWARVRNLGAGAREAWDKLADVASEWAPKILGFLTNPVGALLGHGWLELPDRYKPGILNTILEYSEAIFGRIQDVFALVLGPLWAVVRHFMLGFLRRMKEVPDALKVALSNRLALLVSGGSLKFMLHFAKGLGLGIWDFIRLPYDLVLLLIDGARWISDWLARKSGDKEIVPDQQALQAESDAPESDPGADLSTPELALEFVKLIWESITGAVEQMGRGLSQALLDFFQLPDEQMGEQTGRFAGGIAVDVVLAAVTAGIAAILRRAASTAVQVVRLIKVFAKARKILRMIRNVVMPLVGGVRKAVVLFRRTRFIGALRRFEKWLNKALKAVFAADIAQTLLEKGAPPEEEAAEEEDLTAEEPEPELEEAGAEAGAAPAETEEEPEYEEVEIHLEEYEVDELGPEERAFFGLDEGRGETTVGESILRFPIQLVKKKKRRIKSGTGFERDVIKGLREGKVGRLPKMRFAMRGQHSRSGHGIDILAGIGKGKGCIFYLLEVKGGAELELKITEFGVQTSPQWTARKVEQFFGDTPYAKRRVSKLMRLARIKSREVLKARILRGRTHLIRGAETKIRKEARKLIAKAKKRAKKRGLPSPLRTVIPFARKLRGRK
jgi:Domain of unknown function (DUF4157)